MFAFSLIILVALWFQGQKMKENRERIEDLAKSSGFDSVYQYEAALEQGYRSKSEYDAYIQKKDKAEKDAAAQGGFLSVDEYKKAQYVNMPTKALYDKYLQQQAELKLAEGKRKAEEAEKARLAVAAEENRKDEEAEGAASAAEAEAEKARSEALELAEAQSRLLNSQWYGLIRTSIPYDYDKLVGKTCSEIDNLLRSTKSESGDFLVQGSYFGVNDENKLFWGALILEPKYDCDVEFGFSCESMKVNSSYENIVTSTDTGLATILINSDGGETHIDYKDLALGYVNTTHYYGEKLKKQFDKVSVENRDLVCVEPRQ